MTLPPQNPPEGKQLFTQDEMDHYHARRWAKEKIETLDAEVLADRKRALEATATFTAELRALRDLMTALPLTIASQVQSMSKELKQEIEDNFQGKVEAVNMERRIEEKISDNNAALKEQLHLVDQKIDKTKTDLSTEIADVKNMVKMQWAKITVSLATLGAIGKILGLY